MGQSGQSTASPSLDVYAGYAGSAESRSESVRLEADAVVSQALARRHVETAPFRGMQTASTLRSLICSPNSADAILPVSFPPPAPSTPRKPTLHALQEWEGHVVHIEHDAFVARLVDLTAGMSHEGEEATISLDEISERDVARMEVGSIFRWVIGYERSPEGTQKRVSQFVFRDLPRMTESDLRTGREWAGKIAAVLNP